MAISRVHTWSAGEVLLASDLNAEFSNILNNGSDLVSPFTKAISLGGFALNFDAANTIAMTGATNGVSLTGGAFNTAQGADIVASATLNLDTATGNSPDVTGNTGITAVTLSQGRTRLVRFTGTPTITNGASLVVEGGADFTAVAGQYVLFIGYASSVVRCVPFVTPAATQTLTNKTITVKDANFTLQDDGDTTKQAQVQLSGLTASTTRTLTLQDQSTTIGSLSRSYLAGLTMSTAGASATMTIAAGQATDSTNAMMMTLASSIGKTTSAWAVGTGNGGLDTGSIANTTWYKFYEIMRPDTGVVDVIFTIAVLATGPAMPANYTKFRYIGSGLTNGSAQWVAFTQDGDLFEWTAIVADISSNNPGTSAVSRTLTVPTGVNVEAIFQGIIQNLSAGSGCYTIFTDLATNDQAPGSTMTDLPVAQSAANAVTISAGRLRVRTNTSAQVRSRVSFGDANVTLTMNTFGWVDRRGRDA